MLEGLVLEYVLLTYAMNATKEGAVKVDSRTRYFWGEAGSVATVVY